MVLTVCQATLVGVLLEAILYGLQHLWLCLSLSTYTGTASRRICDTFHGTFYNPVASSSEDVDVLLPNDNHGSFIHRNYSSA